MQAGVGIGKSFGYLLPIFYTYKNVKDFKKIIISTSSIALQDQLLKDIKILSDMLEIDIKADIAKGVNNYACLKRIYHHIGSSFTLPQNKEILEMLAEQIEKIESSDKVDLITVSENVWKSVQLQSRGYCSMCTYSRLCPFYKKQQSLDNSNIIITNHANMVNGILSHANMFDKVDTIIFDEVHKLEENIRNVQLEELSSKSLVNCIKNVMFILMQRYGDDIVSYNDISADNDILTAFKSTLISDINNLFFMIRESAKNNFYNMKKGFEEDRSITESNRLSFRVNNDMIMQLNNVLKDLSTLFKLVEVYERSNGMTLKIKELEYLRNAKSVFQDMQKGYNSTNIYWADFYKQQRISICYAPKSIQKVSDKIFSKNVPIICTSGTIYDEENKYSYFTGGVELEKTVTGRTISYGDVQKSPYDYENNSLFYYNPTVANPKEKESYIIDLAVEIGDLIRATEGKALILFTSKKTMNSVYELLMLEEFPFKILLHNDNNANEIKKHFSEDTNSCLLATGAFWEGVDIKGKSLSNLIITRLPFDQVDAINQYKASRFSKYEQFREVYFPNMLNKLKQAVGRLIRSDTDTGIVCCLDSRFANYKDAIVPNLPMTNYTIDKKEVYQFVNAKILDYSLEDGVQRVRKPE